MSLSIRKTGPADIALVMDFVRKLAVYEKLEHKVVATEDMIAAAMFSDYAKVFADIAEWNGEPAGFVLWFYNFSTFHGRHGIYLEDLFVEPHYRGKGIGKALIKHLARRCSAEGLTRLQWSVLNWNEPSIAFYRSLGAVAIDEWTVMRVSDQALADLAK